MKTLFYYSIVSKIYFEKSTSIPDYEAFMIAIYIINILELFLKSIWINIYLLISFLCLVIGNTLISRRSLGKLLSRKFNNYFAEFWERYY